MVIAEKVRFAIKYWEFAMKSFSDNYWNKDYILFF